MIHCDWLELEQAHPSLPHRPFSAELAVFTDATSGEVSEQRYTWKSVPGEFGANLQIRSDGSRVQVSGNPSRWSRPDAFWGVSFDQAIEVINGLLIDNGIPPFSGVKPVLMADERLLVGEGAKLRRVDLTTSFITGGPRERDAFLLSLRARRHPRGIGASLYQQNFNVTYGFGSRRLELQAYDKALEIRETRKASPWYSECANWFDQVGLVRVELRLRSKELKARNLRQLYAVTHEKLAAVFSEEVSFMTDVEAKVELADIPRHLVPTLGLWLLGLDVRSIVRRTKYYAHRKALLAYGYDIGVETNVVRLPLRPVVINLQVAEPPDWYIEGHKRMQAELREQAAAEGRVVRPSGMVVEAASA